MTDNNAVAAARRDAIRAEYADEESVSEQGETYTYMATFRPDNDEPATLLALCASKAVAEFACNDHYNDDYSDNARVLDPNAWQEPELGMWSVVAGSGSYWITLLPGGINVAMTFADGDSDG